jgi:hypothetical protein
VSAFLLNVAAAGGYLAVQEEAPAALPLSSSMVLSGPASPATRQRRDLLQTSLEFVEKLCDISMVLAKLQPVGGCVGRGGGQQQVDCCGSARMTWQ